MCQKYYKLYKFLFIKNSFEWAIKLCYNVEIANKDSYIETINEMVR